MCRNSNISFSNKTDYMNKSFPRTIGSRMESRYVYRLKSYGSKVKTGSLSSFERWEFFGFGKFNSVRRKCQEIGKGQ